MMPRPLVALLIPFMGGIVIGSRFPGQNVPAIAAAVATGLLLWRVCRRRASLFPVLVLFCALGVLSIQPRVAPERPPHHVVHFTDGERYGITGTVLTEPLARRGRTSFTAELDTLGEKGKRHPVTGRIRVTVYGDPPDFKRGDRVRFASKIKPIRNFHNPGAFDYRRYMRFQRIEGAAWTRGEAFSVVDRSVKWTWHHGLERFRKRLSRTIDQNAEPRAAAVLNALMIGDRSRIPPSLRDAFNRVGIGHLLAISGLHIGIVATVCFFVFTGLLSLFPFLLWNAWVRRGAALLSIPPVLAYGLLSGMSPSTQRAVIMVVVFLVSFLIQKEHDILNALALAALLIVLAHPPSVFSISFQLSFTAVFAIVYGLSKVKPVPDGLPPRRPWMRKVLAFLWVSLFATIGTLPAVMFYFNRVSLVGVPANFIFVPLIGFAVVPSGLLAVLFQALWPPLAAWTIAFAGRITELSVTAVQYLSDLPFAAVRTVTPSLLEIVLFYALVWSVIEWIGTWKQADRPGGGSTNRDRKRLGAMAAFLVLALVLDAGYWVQQRYGRSELAVTVIDVGQGAAALVEFPHGRVFLIDGGGFSDNAAFDVGARVVGPLLWRKKIMTVDTVILTHPNSDHLNGLLFIVSQFDVRCVWTNGETADTEGYRRFREIIDRRRIPMKDFEALPRRHHVNGALLEVLYPPANFSDLRMKEAWRSANNNSMVVRLRLGGVSFLFPGDIEAPAESDLVQRAGARLKSTILVAPHHGSRTSSTAPFINCVDPEIVAVSAGWQNRYHFPHSGVLARYGRKGCRVYRTDRHGAIRFQTDGKGLQIVTQLPAEVFSFPEKAFRMN